ncbi:MAG: hypothetical protein RLZZ215_161 [Pseudomonadota bacterium]|jgi:putative tricarboxylic transport membrane protein
MADRIFAAITLLVVMAYGWAAFMLIKAPFQYDPLGPESWPRILSVVAGLCCLWIILKPTVHEFDITQHALVRIGIMVGLLIAYAYLFEHAGFIIATALYCAASAKLLGSTLKQAVIFGLVTSIVGYLVSAKLLELNIPAGVFKNLI